MALTNGYYSPVNKKQVIHWPTPDADGDGDDVYEDLVTNQGEHLGRNLVRDSQNRTVKHYAEPEGFRNIRSEDGTDNYVKVDHRGRVWRHPRSGLAMGIKPGQTLVVSPNGDFEYLNDDYSRHLFEQAHEPVDDAEKSGTEIASFKTDEEVAEDNAKRDQAEFEAWKKQRDSEEQK